MERYTVFLDWKKQYCQNDYMTPKQSTDSVQSLSNYQWRFFNRTRTKTFIICMETQKIPNGQNNLDTEKWNWKNQTPWLQTILQSYSHQNSMVLAQRQIHRLMEHDRKPRNIQILCINVCVWNLERWCWWTYLQGSNGDADTENRLVGTVEEGESGTDWESSMETYSLPYVK